MTDVEVVVYNIAAFVCALFVLEFGADKFVDHTAIVAQRTGISPTVIALLTAGAEWEELAVVVLSIAQHRSSLAVGNIVGSAISNILGAFSLGLLFSPSGGEAIIFDSSAKLYCSLLLVVTCTISGLLAFAYEIVWKALGGSLIGIFGFYLITIFWTIKRGTLAAPELSDDDSDSSDEEESALIADHAAYRTFDSEESAIGNGDRSLVNGTSAPTVQRADSPFTSSTTEDLFPSSGARHSLTYHVAYLFIGMAALVLSAYVLSHSASSIIEATGISDVLFGVIILSFATTLPEKLVAVVSGSRGHAGVMVASTVGSNIFLLTLCMGILWLATGNDLNQGSVNIVEIAFMLAASAAMTLTVWLGTNSPRLIGAAMLAGYIAFIAVEFIVVRRL